MRTIILSAFILACSNNEKPSAVADVDEPPIDNEPFRCERDSQCDSHEICEEPDCVPGDRSDDFSEAISIEASTSDTDNSASGHINKKGDADYWQFVSSGKQFITAKISNENFLISTEDDALRPDLFLTLYDEGGNVVTSADNYPNGGSVNNYDSVVFAYLESAGNYTFVVEDSNEKNNRGDTGDYDDLYGEDYTYSIEVFRQQGTDGLESSFEEPILRDESNSTGVQLKTSEWRSIGVLIDEPGEVDYVAVLFDNDNLTLEKDTDPDGNIYTWDGGLLTVAGIEDLRGSNPNIEPAVQVYTPDDDIVSSGVDVGPSQTMKYGALTKGQYILALSDANGGGGPDYWFYVLLLAENAGDNIPFEEEENGMSSFANVIETTEVDKDDGKRFSQGSVQGFVNNAGDNDWFTISAPTDVVGENTEGEDAQWVVVCANSTLWGSSSTPTIRVYDESGSILGESASNREEEPNVRIENIEIEPGEQLNIQVDAGPDSEGAPDEWYRMKVFIAGFRVKSYDDGGYVCP